MKKISIFYAWPDENKGDMAITIGLINTIKEIFDNPKISIYSMYSKTDNKYYSTKYVNEVYNDVKVEESPFQIIKNKYKKHKIISIFYILFNIFCLLIIPTTYKKMIHNDSFNKIYNSDLIIINGGHLLFSYKNNSILKKYIYLFIDNWNIIFIILLAKKMKIDYSFWGHSFGPFEEFKSVYKIIISNAKYIFCRETFSKNNLESIGVIDKVKVIPDFAFFLPKIVYQKNFYNKLKLNDKKYICLTLRKSSSKNYIIDKKEYKNFLYEISEVIINLISDGYFVIALPHTISNNLNENDIEVGKELEKIVNNDNFYIIDTQITIEEIRYLIKKSEMLIATRFHSAIFSILEHTPFILLSNDMFGPKTKGIMKDLQLEYLLIDYNEQKTKIYDKINYILNNRRIVSINIRMKYETYIKNKDILIDIFKKKNLLYIAASNYANITQREQHIYSIMTQYYNVYYIQQILSFNILKWIKNKMILIEKDKDLIILSFPVIPFLNRIDLFNKVYDKVYITIINRKYKFIQNDTLLGIGIPKMEYFYINFKALTKYYDCMDNRNELSKYYKHNNRNTDKIENNIISSSNIVFISSCKLKKIINFETPIIINNAVNKKYINKKYEIKPYDFPQDHDNIILGYIGAINKWFDVDTLLYTLKNSTNIILLLIGPIETDTYLINLLLSQPNCYYLGTKNHSEIFNYIYYFDYALIPFKINEVTNYVNPIKLYEYAALNKKIISSPLPEIHKYSKDVFIYNSKQEFIDIINTNMNTIKNSLHIAINNTWEKRVKIMKNELEKYK